MRFRVQGAWLPWLSAALLAMLCAILGLLQYRWTGEIAVAERRSLQEDLQARLMSASRAFNQNISSTLRELAPSDQEIEQEGREAAWSSRFLLWKQAHPQLLTSAGIETADGGYLGIDPQSGKLAAAERPDARSLAALEFPVMDRVRDRMLVELNLDYVRTAVLPELIAQYVANAGTLDYDIEVVTASQPAQLIYANFPGASVWDTADGSAPLLDPRPNNGAGRPGAFGGGPPPPGDRRGGDDGFLFGRRGPGGPPPFEGPERWRLLARHKAGSLETLVATTQRRNLAVTGAVLLLIVGTVVMLIRYTRQTQRLAQLQMNFVTGVSHELRTPLTVIRTAAYNLRNPEFRRSEDRIVRYGQLIETETGKLEGLVDQVMRFSGANAGHAIRQREPLDVAALICAEVASLGIAAEGRGVSIAEDIEPGLPTVVGDRDALSQALRNLLDNALKHGAGQNGWIGIHARTVRTGAGKSVEITVADKGPGIPPDEKALIFDPFFRGRRALHDQVRGTGLGLNLVKSIIEAHGGSVSVTSDTAGTRFIIRIPAEPETGAHA
jgi:signal transduction histidine kinase